MLPLLVPVGLAEAFFPFPCSLQVSSVSATIVVQRSKRVSGVSVGPVRNGVCSSAVELFCSLSSSCLWDM